MCSTEIQAYAREEMHIIDAEVQSLVAYSQKLSEEGNTAQDRLPILQGIERILDRLQPLYDRCCERFPAVEEDGSPDLYLAYMRRLISKCHALWELWDMPDK